MIGTLKTAFVDGRLTKDELDARAAQAFGARTVADLAKLTADIPAGRAAAPLARPAAPAHRRPLARAAVKAVICLIIAATAWWVASIADPGAPAPVPILPGLPRWFCWPLSPYSRRSASWRTGWSRRGS